MNFKTSVTLTIVLAVVLAGFLVLRASDKGEPEKETPALPTSRLEKALFDDPPEDVVKIVCTQAGGAPWRFARSPKEGSDESVPSRDPERDQGGSVKPRTPRSDVRGEGADSLGEWRLTEPVEAKVTGYTVDGIVNRLKNLKYQVKYQAGDSNAVTPEQAGLKPPKVSVELEEKDGTRRTVRVGKLASNRETFVQLGDSDDVYVVLSALDSLLRERVEEYREREMFNFKAEDAVSLEMDQTSDDGQRVHYRLVKNDRDGWVFEEPFNADADDAAIRTAVQSLSRLRASDWVAIGGSPDLGLYGMRPPRLDIEVTCEVKSQVPADEAEGAESAETEPDETGEEKAKPKMVEKVETKVYRALVGSRGPLGKADQTFAKIEDESAVAAIPKATADALTPDVEKWRNLSIVRNKVVGANRINIRKGAETPITLVKGPGGLWRFEERDDKAESPAVKELLDKIDAIKAVTFTDSVDTTDPQYGLDPGSVEITISLPGRSDPERITVGDATDPETRRLFYLRSGDSASIAKVRAEDITLLTQDTLAYESREIVNLAPSDLESIDVSRVNQATSAMEVFTLERAAGEAWRMTAPVEAKTDPAAVTVMVGALATLKAERVVARSGDPGEFGLNQPEVQLALAYKPATTLDKADELAEPAESPTAAPDMFLLRLTSHRGNVYAKRSERETIYQLRRPDYAAFLAEFHEHDVWDLDDAEQITSVGVASGGVAYRFDRGPVGWVYAAEPDLPIDPAKVDEFVGKVRNLKLDRFVAYGRADMAAYGLDSPERSVTVVTEAGGSRTLLISGAPCGQMRKLQHCAALQGSSDVFTLSDDVVSILDVKIADFEKATGS